MDKKIWAIFVIGLVVFPVLTVAGQNIETQEKENTVGFTAPEIEIVRPRSGFLYIKNKELVYIGQTVVIGPRKGVDVWVDVKGDHKTIDHIEFYQNEKLVGVGTWNPFIRYYTWRCNQLGFSNLNITVVPVYTENIGKSLQSGGDQTIDMFYFNIIKMLQLED